jgi:glycosyltransferase involved in cell wall biosynthesis
MMFNRTQIEQENVVSFTPILDRYLLVTFCIPFYINAQGRRYLDRLWVKDLVEHFKYLKNFTLASPCRYEDPPEGAIFLDSEPAFADVQFIDLPISNSTIDALRLLPKTISKLWKAVGEADIVHTGIADWPIPAGWLLTPIARLRRKFYLIIVESAFWRVDPGVPKPLKSRIRAYIVERVNRWCVNNTDLALFTQDQYRRTLLTQAPERGHIINASWIDEQAILSDAEATEIWQQKRSAFSGELRILFAGRLVSSKGVRVLLAAMKSLSTAGVPIQLDILGQGDLLAECEQASQQIQPPAQIRLLKTVAYGSVFFNLLRTYQAIVVPSVSDEQPRVVYDAYSQGIPVLASNTAGIQDCVEDGETGKLVPLNDPIALAELLKWALQNQDQLEKMGLNSLKKARSLTHQEMHHQRWQILLNALNQSPLRQYS